MIEYKIRYIKTDLTSITNEDVYNKSFQIYYNDSFHDIIEVLDEFYRVLEIDTISRLKNNPMGLMIHKSLIKEIYKPVIELIDESFNQLILTKDLIITQKEYDNIK